MTTEGQVLAELQGIRQELTTISRLLGAQVGSDLKMAERAPLLKRLGLTNNAIADVCNSNPNVVSVRLAESRRGTKSRREQTVQAAP